MTASTEAAQAERDVDEARIIIGIDPGTKLLGFGVIRAVGRKAEFVDMGVLDLRHEATAYIKLRQIYETVSELCKTYHGDEIALESPFYAKNAQVILKLGRAQGAAMIAAMEQGIGKVAEYAPRRAKEVVTGNGAASKEQVSLMLQKTLGVTFDEEAYPLDATDALGVALCHFYETTGALAGMTSKGSWEKFVKEHPDRVK